MILKGFRISRDKVALRPRKNTKAYDQSADVYLILARGATNRLSTSEMGKPTRTTTASTPLTSDAGEAAGNGLGTLDSGSTNQFITQ